MSRNHNPTEKEILQRARRKGFKLTRIGRRVVSIDFMLGIFGHPTYRQNTPAWMVLGHRNPNGGL